MPCRSRPTGWPPRPAAGLIIDLDEMLADPAVDIVTIGTPSGAHLEPAVAAAKAGKHVIVEKPLEITLKRCDAIIAACQKHKVKLSTIFPSRFHDAQPRVETGRRCGPLRPAHAGGRLCQMVSHAGLLRQRRAGAARGNYDGGGALMNQAIHSVDLLTWLMGPVVEMQAQTATLAHERIAVEDTAVATLRFANGALGVIEATHGRVSRLSRSGSSCTAPKARQ